VEGGQFEVVKGAAVSGEGSQKEKKEKDVEENRNEEKVEDGE
tara:strand:+ start:169 stop:294 length:126 start_codon:yes stop_codon:yes gene_type:complete